MGASDRSEKSSVKLHSKISAPLIYCMYEHWFSEKNVKTRRFIQKQWGWLLWQWSYKVTRLECDIRGVGAFREAGTAAKLKAVIW